MGKLEDILDDCLARLGNGEATLEDCLARYPEHAAELRRLLAAAAQVELGRVVRPTPAFKARNRAQLLASLQSRPRPGPAGGSGLAPLAGLFSVGPRLTVGLAALLGVLLIAGLGAAQAALPGDALYDWKLASERAWRAVAPDPLAIDLALTGRRADELQAVVGDPGREPLAWQGYHQSLVTLSRYTDPTARGLIVAALVEQQSELRQAGLTVPELETLISVMQLPPGTPTALPPSPPPTVTLPGVTSTLPPVATAVPQVTAETTVLPLATPSPIPLQPSPGVPTALPSLQPTLPLTSGPLPTTIVNTLVPSVLPPLP